MTTTTTRRPRCGDVTATLAPCKRYGRWQVAGMLLRERCYQHALERARDEGAATIVDIYAARAVTVATVAPRARRFTAPTSRDQALTAAKRARTLREYHTVAMAVLNSEPPWLKLGARDDPLWQALLSAYGRARTAATPADLARYAGPPTNADREVS